MNRTRSAGVVVTAVASVLAACSAVPSASPSPEPMATAAVSSTAGTGSPTPPEGTRAPPPPDEDSPPTSFDLVNAALARGEIDDEQALVYRLLAMFDDPRLPERYRGDDEGAESHTALPEADARFAELSPENQQIVAPFLMWPGHEGSWLDLRLAGGAHIAAAGVLHVATGHEEAELVNVDVSRHALFWHRKDRPQDAALARILASALDSEIWPKLTGLMGEPLSDLGTEGVQGEDGRVDVVLAGEPIRSYANTIQGCGLRNGYPGYTVLGSEGANSAVLAHELMHIIQYRFPLRTGCHWPEYSWLHEATAQWAKDYVDSTSQTERNKRIPACLLRQPGLPLEMRTDCKEYAAYLFFQYLDRSYGPGYIREVWEAAAEHDSLAAIDHAVKPIGGLKSIWPEFALTMYNRDPVLHFNRWDAFDDGSRFEETYATVGDGNVERYPVRGDVEHLAASYHRFHFEDPNINRISFKHPFAGGGQPSAKVQAAMRSVDHGWQIQDWTGEAEKEFCLTDPDDPEVRELILVITNSEFINRRSVLQANPLPELEVGTTCGAWLVSYTYTGKGVDHPALEGDRAADIEWTLSGRLDPDGTGEDDLAGVGTFSGTYWEAQRLTGGGEWEYCKSMAIQGQMSLYGSIDGDELFVYGVPSGEDAVDYWWLALRGTVPLEGGTATDSRPAPVRRHPPDEPLGIFTCPGLADTTSVLEVRPSGPTSP